jgi:hypothetical protein
MALSVIYISIFIYEMFEKNVTNMIFFPKRNEGERPEEN